MPHRQKAFSLLSFLIASLLGLFLISAGIHLLSGMQSLWKNIHCSTVNAQNMLVAQMHVIQRLEMAGYLGCRHLAEVFPIHYPDKDFSQVRANGISTADHQLSIWQIDPEIIRITEYDQAGLKLANVATIARSQGWLVADCYQAYSVNLIPNTTPSEKVWFQERTTIKNMENAFLAKVHWYEIYQKGSTLYERDRYGRTLPIIDDVEDFSINEDHLHLTIGGQTWIHPLNR